MAVFDLSTVYFQIIFMLIGLNRIVQFYGDNRGDYMAAYPVILIYVRERANVLK